MQNFAETGIMPEEMLFNDSEEAIKRFTGLTLTNIEQAGLKKIVSEIYKFQVEQIRKKNETGADIDYVPPVDEAIARFLSEFYDISEDKIKWKQLFELSVNKDGSREASGRVKEYFLRK